MSFIETKQKPSRATTFVNNCSLLWRRQWHPTPVLLPGKSHGWRSLVPGLFAEGSGAGGVQTAKASRKQSSLSGKESAQGCIPKRLLGRPD